MSQIALPLDWPAEEREDAFIASSANAEVLRHLGHVGLWPVKATILVGPRKSGRSLLGRIFAAKTGGRLIDDAERQEEEAIFHAWNHAQEARRPLLIIADAPPPGWRVALPDLASRLAATPVARLQEPDDALILALVERLLARRGLVLPPEVARWLATRIERSYVGVLRAVEILDAEMLARRQRLTVPLARRALEAAGVIDET
ncbi:HdaA/DnaA family protein [Sphingomonas quercus]|uniref:Chromosomal replication initiator DnaA n=1 Tax=Sphingomonas quercus TaxID=2842451 RepID=A0ABS6BGM4_9SPHN|nr:DnaA/Hda family protein [Sphingomonas quercus]MBU3077445.1 chromosomal replication initiator DnaA [Sphingomonas quercus]